MAAGSEHPVSGLVYQNAKSSWKCIVIPAVPGHVRNPERPTCGDGFGFGGSGSRVRGSGS